MTDQDAAFEKFWESQRTSIVDEHIDNLTKKFAKGVWQASRAVAMASRIEGPSGSVFMVHNKAYAVYFATKELAEKAHAELTTSATIHYSISEIPVGGLSAPKLAWEDVEKLFPPEGAAGKEARSHGMGFSVRAFTTGVQWLRTEMKRKYNGQG